MTSKKTEPQPTTEELLAAIAKVNGHPDPDNWTKQVLVALKKDDADV